MAIAAMPSPRPVRPRPSVVVPETDDRAADRRRRAPAGPRRAGCRSSGALPITCTAALPTVQPSAATSRRTSASSAHPARARPLRTAGAEHRAEIAEPGRGQQRVAQRVRGDVAVGVARRSRRRRPSAARPPSTPGPAATGCTSVPIPTLTGGSSRPPAARRAPGPRRCAPRTPPGARARRARCRLPPCARRITASGSSAMQSGSSRARTAIGVCTTRSPARSGVPVTTPAVVHLLDGVGERQHRHGRCACPPRTASTTAAAQPGRSQRPAGVVQQHDVAGTRCDESVTSRGVRLVAAVCASSAACSRHVDGLARARAFDLEAHRVGA